MRCVLASIVICLALLGPARAENTPNGGDEKELTVSARRIETPVLKRRLLPAEYELREGNAAPILLRLPWDQTLFFAQEVPKFGAILEIPLAEDERIREAGAGLPPRFYAELRRAAFRRAAAWEYPLEQKPLGDVMLPDVQGARAIVGQGLSVWIRYQIVTGQTDRAREGILVGLANARHYARTPFVVCQLAPAAFANMMLDRLEELVQHPESPNFYWPLTALPAPFIDFRRALEFEHEFLRQSVDGADDVPKVRNPEEWQTLAEQLIQYIKENAQNAKPDFQDTVATQRRTVETARKELAELEPDLAQRVPEMTDGELTVRWILSRRDEISDRIATTFALDPIMAIERLRGIDNEIRVFTQEHGLPYLFMVDKPLQIYLSSLRFDRRVAALRVVEGVRHYAATHDGKLPERLDQLAETPAPRDPLTGKPFEYGANLKTGRFRVVAPGVEVDDKLHNAIEFEVRLKGN